MVELVEIAKIGNLSKIREYVLNRGYDVNFRCPPDGSTPLYWAACSGHVIVCDWLINNGAEVNLATTKSGSTALHCAADRGHYECVELLLRRDSQIDKQTTGNGDTALHLAAYRGHLTICRLLLDHGASYTVSNNQGRTALEESQIKNHSFVCQLILQHQQFKESQQQDFYRYERSKSDERKILSKSAANLFRDDSNNKSGLNSRLTFDFDKYRLPENKSKSDSSPLACVVVTHEGIRTWPSHESDTKTTMSSDSSRHSSFASNSNSTETIKSLQLKVAQLESYTETLQLELAVRDDNLDRLKTENAAMKRQLEMSKALIPSTEELANLHRKAEMGTTRADAAERELHEMKRLCAAMEKIFYGDQHELLTNEEKESDKSNLK